jgi:ComEC/Rec2-related protein
MSVIHNKAAIAGFSYFCGVGTAHFMHRIDFFWVIPAAAVIGALLLRKRPAVGLMLVCLGAGAVVFTIYDMTQRQPVFEKAGQVIEITGTVEEKKALMFYTAVYTVKTEINGVSTRVLLNAPDVHYINEGALIQTYGALHEIRDTGIFPERFYNLSKGVLLKGDVDSIELIGHSVKTPLHYIRRYNEFIKARVMSTFPNDVGGLLCAVFLGDRSLVSPEMIQDIQIAGAVHFTAVSGLHLTMITHMLMIVFSLTPYRANRKVKFTVLVISVAVLAVFFNLTVSVTRAAGMLVVFYGRELVLRKGTHPAKGKSLRGGNVLNSMGFVLLLILLFEPYAVFDAGLIMSFSGTFGVGVVAPVLLTKRANRIKEAFVISVCASLCVLPACALFFGGISVLSPLTSVIILPFFTVAAGVMVLFAVTGGVIKMFLLIAGIASRIIGAVVEFFSGFTELFIRLDYWFVPFWLGFAVIAVTVIRVIYKSDVKAIKAGCIAVATLGLMISVYSMNAANCTRTYISIYSDKTAAWADIRQCATRVVIVTADTPRARAQINTDEVILLRSVRNNAEAFGGVAQHGLYDINGKFTLDVGGQTLLTADDFSLLFTSNSIIAGDYTIYFSDVYYEPIYLMIG